MAQRPMMRGIAGALLFLALMASARLPTGRLRESDHGE